MAEIDPSEGLKEWLRMRPGKKSVVITTDRTSFLIAFLEWLSAQPAVPQDSVTVKFCKDANPVECAEHEAAVRERDAEIERLNRRHRERGTVLDQFRTALRECRAELHALRKD